MQYLPNLRYIGFESANQARCTSESAVSGAFSSQLNCLERGLCQKDALHGGQSAQHEQRHTCHCCNIGGQNLFVRSLYVAKMA